MIVSAVVFSTSYGEAENTVSMAYMNRVEEELQKQAAAPDELSAGMKSHTSGG